MINTLDRTESAMSHAPQFALIAAIGCLTACSTTADNANSAYDTATITFDKYHTVEDAVLVLGSARHIRAMFTGFQEHLYAPQPAA